MNAVRDKATLSEKTVQKIAKGETKKTKRPRTRRVYGTRVKTSSWSDGVDPRIVAYIKAQKIPYYLIEVRGPEEVYIHNSAQLAKAKGIVK